jgi:hypothetical protein
MKYPMRVLGQMGFEGSLMINNADYTSLGIGENVVTSFEIDTDGDDHYEEDISNVMKEPIWFLRMIFEEVEDWDLFEI